MGFYQEEGFNKEQYDSCLRRLQYDDRDAIMYENMLDFLWDCILQRSFQDQKGLLAEYTRWNLQYIDKVYYREQQLPYAELQRAYQSVIYLLADQWKEGLEQLSMIREAAFQYDGCAPKTIMVNSGKVFRPCSRLFVIYNYYKYFKHHGMEKEMEDLKLVYPYAFQTFGDERHVQHDLFLKEQLEVYGDRIFYPVFHRVYKLPRGPKDFFIYCEAEENIIL